MSSVQKFTFDLDFGAPETPSEPETVEEAEEELEPEIELPTFSEEEIEQARTDGFEAGREEGRRDAAAATEQRLVEGIDGIAQQLSDLLAAQSAENEKIGREMAAVAVGITKKVFPDLNARNALGEIERIIQETLGAITEEPRVQVFVSPDLREPMNERLTVLTSRAAFDGKVFVNADPTLELGDCRIEWSNGSAIRDTETLWEMIDDIVERNLHGDPAPPPPENDAPAADPVSADPAPAEPMPSDPPPSAEAAPEADLAPTDHESVGAGHTESPAHTPAPAPEAPAPDADAGLPDADPHAHEETPFAPNVDNEAAADQPVNTDINQEVELSDPGPPVPHAADDSSPAGDGKAAMDSATAEAPPVTQGESISQETTAAILEAQGSMHTETDPDEKA